MINEPAPGRLAATVEHDFELGLGYVLPQGELDAASAPTARSAILMQPLPHVARDSPLACPICV